MVLDWSHFALAGEEIPYTLYYHERAQIPYPDIFVSWASNKPIDTKIYIAPSHPAKALYVQSPLPNVQYCTISPKGAI